MGRQLIASALCWVACLASIVNAVTINMHWGCTGAMSMAVGEYIFVASQQDTEQADIDKEREALNSGPQVRQMELEELTQIYVQRGLNDRLAREVAVALTEKDAVRAHARVSANCA